MRQYLDVFVFSRIDDLNAQVRRLELTAEQKEERYLTLEKR